MSTPATDAAASTTDGFMNVALILLVYILVSSIVSIYIAIKSKNNIKRKFIELFLSSSVAITLLPLFLNSIGNPILRNVLNNNYSIADLFELAAFVAAASLASRKIIDITLASLKLNDVEKQLNETKNVLGGYEDGQKVLLDRRVKDDKELLDDEKIRAFSDVLTHLSSKDRVPISISTENELIVRDLESNRYINTYGPITVGTACTCSITKLGEQFLRASTQKA